MSHLAEIIKEKRKTLSDSSAKTYASILNNMYKKVYPNDSTFDIEKFNDTDKFLDLLKNMDFRKRKSYLTALVVFTGDETYSKEMMIDGSKFNDAKKLQQKTEKETKNWVSQDDLKTIFARYEHDSKILYKFTALKSEHIQHIQNYVILAVMSGLFIPIRRLQDWTEMKYKSVTKSTDNYFENKPKWKFVFNKFKTAKFLGEQTIDIQPDLKKIINKWLKLLVNNYPDNTHLFIDSQGQPLNPSKLNQRLNKIFGKNASVNILRHSFISEKYKNLPALKALTDEAKDMGHSLEEHLSYIKK